jgi:hypothetical protein
VDAYGCSFLVRRQRVNAPKRPAEDTLQAPESGGAVPKGRGASAPSAESAAAAGSAPLRGDPEAGAQAPERQGGGQREGGAVQSRFAVGAACCGALGCRETGGLLEVEREGQVRVLCPDCAAGWSP